jgi:hypothetical protein
MTVQSEPSGSTPARPALDELLAKWTRILKLQDWECKASYARHWELGENNAGSNRVSYRNKCCTIRILEPCDYGESIWPQDVESTLVHELLHLHFELRAPVEGVADDLREQAIESITRALIELDRRR